jgi:predicted nucleotidyltransferase
VAKIKELELEPRSFDFAERSVFGSVARGEATETSDIDFLVRSHHGPTFKGLFDMVEFLEKTLPRHIVLDSATLSSPAFRKESSLR